MNGGNDMQSQRICKQCLLAELASEQDLYSLIQSRIALLTEAEKGNGCGVPKQARRLQSLRSTL